MNRSDVSLRNRALSDCNSEVGEGSFVLDTLVLHRLWYCYNGVSK